MRKVYLSNTPRREALEQFLASQSLPRRILDMKTTAALGMVTAGPVMARYSLPGHHAAAMDGIAVVAEETFAASDQQPLRLSAGEGYHPVNTGGTLPAGCNAVIKIEDVHFTESDEAEILAPATPWQHVRAVGEDIVAGELIVPGGHRLRPPDLGALLAAGISDVEVVAKARIAVIPSGSEIINAEDGERPPGSVPDFNSTVIAAYLDQWGAEAVICPPVPDEKPAISKALRQALEEYDMALIIAGSSAGEKDYTAAVISEEGELILHGVATRPGKPTILGQVAGKPVVGLPGYPVSAYLSLEWFVQPLVCKHLGLPIPRRPRLEAAMGRRVVSEPGMEEFIRLAVGRVGDRFVANPLDRGAGVTMSLVRADGLVVIPAPSLGFEQDEAVMVELYRPLDELEHNLLAAGSHDLIVDLLATALRQRDPRYSLSSAHLGSMGGILAIGGGRAHLAGIHLFDPAVGTYNVTYVRRHFPRGGICLVNLTYRTQGWLVPRGNPDKLEKIEALAEQEIPFVNRQKGSGTRILFDHLLGKAALTPRQVKGYTREEHTHLNVAASIAAGTARAGLGILPAARAYHLDFIPVGEERFDLLMTEDFIHSPGGILLLELIRDPQFQATVESMGGYSMRRAGVVIDLSGSGE